MSASSPVLFKMRRRLNGIRRDISWQLGLNERQPGKAKGARILVYHGVCRQDHLRFNTLFIQHKTLETHLRLYKKYFNVVSLDDFYRQRFDRDRFTVCLTFDDGFANNYRYVLPLLEQYEVPATFFVTAIREAGYDILWNDFLSIITRYGPQKLVYKGSHYTKHRGRYVAATGEALAWLLRSTGFTAKKELMENLSSLAGFRNDPSDADYWQQMTEEQMRRLAASSRVTIGSHGYYHNDLAAIPVAAAKEEMERSKQYLECIAGKEIKALAFPYGTYSGEIKEEAKRAGFSQLLATDFLLPGDAEDPVLRARLTINPFISPVNQLYAAINGHYG
jgi:peptidoglycan/xylan/chitin deacetylase (PgdA/CDA1 family)